MECTLCDAAGTPPGSYQDLPGQTACKQCGPGRYSANILSCEACAVGEYCEQGVQTGTSCGETMTTDARGANSEAECVCKIGRYKDYTDAVYVDGKLTYASTMCTDCPSIGFDCAEPGNALETLRIKSGFWRSHALSSRVRECLTPEYCVDCTRHADAALCTAAPATADRRLAAQQSISSSNLTNAGCIPLHRGPFCALCVDGSIVGVDSNGQRHCVECQGSIAATFALPLGILAVMLILAFICVRAIPGRLGTLADELNDAVFDVGKTGDLDDVASAVKESAVVVAEAETGEQLSNVSTRLQAAAEKRGCTRERFLSVQVKLRILVSLIQVISQLGVVFQIPYPPFYSDMVDWLGVFSLNFVEMMPLSCFFELDHDHSMLFYTGFPLILGALTALAWRSLMKSVEHKRILAREEVSKGDAHVEGLLKRADEHEALAQQLLTWLFILVYILYPSNSSRIFATLQCDTLDDPASTSYLVIDMSVNCKDPFHQAAQAYAWLMMLIYPLGVPLLYVYLLFFRYGKELRLLRSLELKRVALLEEVKAANELVAAHTDLQTGRAGIWSATILADARHGGSERSLRRQQSSASNLKRDAAKRDVTMRDLHAAKNTAAILAAAKESDAKVARLQSEETRLRDSLPDVVQKLILGYELRIFYFEVIECVRKLLIVCLPVFFSGVTQLVFGLVVCFLTFGAYMMSAPFVGDDDDRLSQICQLQIFFALLCAVMLKYTPEELANANNVDALLSTLTIFPIVFGVYLETPLAEHFSPSNLAEYFKSFRRWSGFFPPPGELPDEPAGDEASHLKRPKEPVANEGNDDHGTSSGTPTFLQLTRPSTCSSVAASQVQVELVEAPHEKPALETTPVV